MSDDEINEAMAIAMTVGASKIRCLYSDSLAPSGGDKSGDGANGSTSEAPPEDSCAP